MTPEAVFSLGGTLALTGWVGLALGALFPAGRRFALAWAGIAVPVVLAVAYVVMLFIGRAAFETGGYGSIEAVRALFANDAALTAGWIHYLAFDLFVGAYVLRDGSARRVPGWTLLPCFVLVFLFGPAGLLAYLAVRTGFGLFVRKELQS